ncbi:hypothetical protein V8G54_004951 [Vigna mungo]|uniref:Transmembrane protein n=1 Tax=Vigna mungo TaxID=3915 RepID=A0AAQ3PIY5_VIGMU
MEDEGAAVFVILGMICRFWIVVGGGWFWKGRTCGLGSLFSLFAIVVPSLHVDKSMRKMVVLPWLLATRFSVGFLCLHDGASMEEASRFWVGYGGDHDVIWGWFLVAGRECGRRDLGNGGKMLMRRRCVGVRWLRRCGFRLGGAIVRLTVAWGYSWC